MTILNFKESHKEKWGLGSGHGGGGLDGDWGDGVLCFVYKEGEEESAFVLFPVSSRSNE